MAVLLWLHNEMVVLKQELQMMDWYRPLQTKEHKTRVTQQCLDTELSFLKVGEQLGSAMPALHLLTTTQRANNGNKPNWPLPWEIGLYWFLLPLHRLTEAVSGVIQVWERLYGHGWNRPWWHHSNMGKATTITAKMEFVFELQKSWIVVCEGNQNPERAAHKATSIGHIGTIS